MKSNKQSGKHTKEKEEELKNRKLKKKSKFCKAVFKRKGKLDDENERNS